MHVKLCGNCNLGLTTLGVFFGVGLNCGKGFRPRTPDVKMSYCTVLRSAKNCYKLDHVYLKQIL